MSDPLEQTPAPLPPEPEWLPQLRELAAAGLSRAEIATRLGRSPGSVLHYLRQYRIPTTGRRGRKPAPPELPPKIVAALEAVDGAAGVRERAAALEALADVVRGIVEGE